METKIETDDARLAIRLQFDLRRRIRMAAAERDISLSMWIKEAAEEKLARRAQPPADAAEGE